MVKSSDHWIRSAHVRLARTSTRSQQLAVEALMPATIHEKVVGNTPQRDSTPQDARPVEKAGF